MITKDTLLARFMGEGWDGVRVKRGLSSDDYHAAPGVSCSLLKKVRPTPAHILGALQEEEAEEKALREECVLRGEVCPSRTERTGHFLIGALVHAATLEPDTLPGIAVTPATYTDEKTGEAKPWTYQAKYCKAWRNAKRAEGKCVISRADFDVANGCVRSLRAHGGAMAYLTGAETEVSVWSRHESGFLLRSRIDCSPAGNVLVDIKTVAKRGDGEPSAFAATMARMDYDMQAAMYLDGWEAATGEKKECFLFIVVEKEPPFAVSIVQPSRDFIEIGRRKYQSRLAQLKSGSWDGYTRNPVVVQPPRWAAAQAEEEWG